MTQRNQRFLKEILPILESLERQWFPVGIKNEDDIEYGCAYCDGSSSYGGEHEYSCLLERAKNALKEINKISSSTGYDKDLKGQDRFPEAIREIKNRFQVEFLLQNFFNPFLDQIVPLDFNDPINKNMGCICSHLAGYGRIRNEHSPSCPFQKLAMVYSNYWNPNLK